MALCLLVAVCIASVVQFHISVCLGVEFVLHASQARGNNLHHFRSQSTSGKVVYLNDNKELSFIFCLRKTTKVSITKLRYSNGNRKDSVKTYIDHNTIGSFDTDSSLGKDDSWNKFLSRTDIGSIKLNEGWHKLGIIVHTSDGLEVDEIRLVLSDETITFDIFNCKLQCQQALPRKSSTFQLGVHRKARIVQETYSTSCAEEDNVKIPIYLDKVKEYKLTASLPTYSTFSNRRGENATGCVDLPPLYWVFQDVSVAMISAKPAYGDARLSVIRKPTKFRKVHRFLITFPLKGISTGNIDARIGSVLTLKIRPVFTSVMVWASCTSAKHNVTYLKRAVLLPGVKHISWNISDYTWSEGVGNSVTISTDSAAAVEIHIEDVRLERRYIHAEKVFTIFKSNDLIVEGVDVDFWWRAPETMTVWLEGTSTHFAKVDFFRVSIPVPWTKGWAQIFVLYQDGNARLLQLPPSGLDWIPFGSSVIIGTTNNTLRPSAPIFRVDIKTDSREFLLHYLNGEKARLVLKAKLAESELTVKDLKFNWQNSGLPFATLRSMHVEDGNSDCDSVMVDNSIVKPIAGRWGSMKGTSFLFFRKCESRHLTLSPDIHIMITRSGH